MHWFNLHEGFKPDLSWSPLEKEMATHSSILAWRIPWTEETCGLQSMGSQESDMTEWFWLDWKTSREVLFLPTSDVYVRSFLYLFYTLIKLYYTKSLSDQALSLAPVWIILFQRPKIQMSFMVQQQLFTMSSPVMLHIEPLDVSNQVNNVRCTKPGKPQVPGTVARHKACMCSIRWKGIAYAGAFDLFVFPSTSVSWPIWL